MTVSEFETLVLAQKPASQPWSAVTDYTFMARREAEGKNPKLIFDVLKPTSILDAGCGPGHLVALLREQRPHASIVGIDKSIHGRVGDLTDTLMWMSWTADLVICREVLEHLTLREVRIAVTNLCKMSSRLVYITTRFHQHPTSFLDVQTADDLDPTHITMMNKDFLRALLVLSLIHI